MREIVVDCPEPDMRVSKQAFFAVNNLMCHFLDFMTEDDRRELAKMLYDAYSSSDDEFSRINTDIIYINESSRPAS